MAINLYAVGVFLAFSLSQTGMVRYWLRKKGPMWHQRALMNGCGAVFTSLVLLVIIVSKFSSGAWLVVLLIPLLVLGLGWIRRRYRLLEQALDIAGLPDASGDAANLPLNSAQDPGCGPILVCLESFDRAAVAAVRQALSMSRHVRVLFVYGEHHDPARIQADWDRLFADQPGLQLSLSPSPYASFINPLVNMVQEVELEEPDQRLTVMMPEVIGSRWFDRYLLNQSIDVVSMALADGRSRLFTRYRHYLPV
jgi:hypothetical protein